MARYIIKDPFYERAKKEGYRARSAYKLEEMQQRFAVIRQGDRVLDLGAAPGSWLQVEARLVGSAGVVVGLDLLPIEPFPFKNIILKRADIREMEIQELLRAVNIPSFDVVTSDIAPNLSGIKDVDNANIYEVYRAVRRVVEEGLRKGGNFVIKLFMNPDLKDMSADLKPIFSKIVPFKPKASRGISSEVYLVCTGKR